MKAKINKDKLTLTELGFQNSGSVNYYEIECEFDESWNELTKEIVLAQSITGIHRAIINNKAYIDKDRSGVYEIGFVGYTIENGVKVYQVSTNLVPVNISKGAGEIDVLDDAVPTPTEWETYIAQIQAMVDEIKDLPSYDITEEDIENWNNKVTDDDYVHTDNNFTDEDKDKLENIEEGAEVNKVDEVEVNGVPVVNNKKAEITVPTKTSQIQNDSNFVSDANYIHTDNNFTTAQKNKLAGLENYDDTEVKQDIQALNSDVEELGTSKQDKQDDDLDTINKIVVNAINEIFASVGGIQGLIPNQASQANQLADKDFVNSSLNSITAFYITKNAQGDPFATKAELTSATVFYSGGEVRVPTRNDYAYVLEDESKTDPVTSEKPSTRYIYQNNQWEYQYTVNKTALTAAQLAAINSGITQALVALISTNQGNIATIMADYIKSTDYATSTKPGIMKVNSTEFGVNVYNGNLYPLIINYATYLTKYGEYFISKGTLENVLTGKGLVKSTTISSSSTDDNVVTPKAVYDYIESLDIEEVSF